MICLSISFLASCNPSLEDDPDTPAIHPDQWPAQSGGVPIDPAIEARIDSLLSIMTIEEKVAQTIQGDISAITPEDIRTYKLGSVLNGGNSAPGGNVRAPAQDWLALADAFYEASIDDSDGGVAIPIIWGTDAVHGQSNIVGATIFPHNIGLGATRNVDLMREIGSVTAVELLVTGLDWTFAPTVAVVRDDRWGRTYESYSENPDVAADYARAMVEGLQGTIGSPEFLTSPKIIATVKHYLGDGGTNQGVDQGDNLDSEADLRDIHGAAYWSAIDAGVQVVMASFSSWHGKKLHGHKELLTDVLKDRVGFNGFVVGDWNGHGAVAGCETTNCPASINAGLDMYMAPDSWKGLYDNTLAQARSGVISAERLDDAVRRILRVKFRAGVFEQVKPSERPLAGQYDLLGAEAHRSLARQAVRESLVLLKNNEGVLPLNPKQHILVAGDGADNIGKQTGGWTLSWQGTGNANTDFPNGQSIWGGIEAAVHAAGGRAVLSVDGSYTQKPDAAIVVFGENPYAEFQGDIPDLDYQPDHAADLALLKSFKDAGIPTVAVFLSGRPLWMNPEINASDAFVAAWLPGTEGGGVADVILANADGSVHADFKGTLSFSWPRTANQTTVNVGDADYDPLFAYGYGLTYADDETLALLSEDPGIESGADNGGVFFDAGVAVAPWRLETVVGSETTVIETLPVAAGDALTLRAVDRDAQEDAIQVTWAGDAEATLFVSGDPIDLARESNGEMAVSIEYRVDTPPTGPVSFIVECGEGCRMALDAAALFGEAPPNEWTRTDVKLNCFADADMTRLSRPLGIRTAGEMVISISSIKLVSNEGSAVCP